MAKAWQDSVVKEYGLAVVIGRFQPVHFGQLYNIDEGLKIADKVLVLIGSAYNSRNPKNPFTFEQRAKMITDYYFQSKDRDRIIIEPLADHLYEENQWVTDVQEVVNTYATKKVALIGHEKDSSSYYLKTFPQWDFIETGKWPDTVKGIDATKIRNLYFKHNLGYIAGVVPITTYQFLEWFSQQQEYADLVEEQNFIDAYREAWRGSPFPNTFATVDAIVIQSGHILLIRRKEQPGKNLMALPGGFLGEEETQEDGVIRELREETKLKVPVPVLRGSIKKEKTFSQPSRSQRGRTITQAYLFQLKNDEDLPKVKGSDDAKEAAWYPLSEFYNMEDQMYEDHFYIVKKMLDNE